MQEIVRVAKEERLIIICTIHQPSTKVYNGFDQLMIMSRGREAFSGDVKDAVPYFDEIGYACPPQMNPAEVRLSLGHTMQRQIWSRLGISPQVYAFFSTFWTW